MASCDLNPNLIRTVALIRNAIGSYTGHISQLDKHNDHSLAIYDVIINLFTHLNFDNIIIEVDNRDIYEGIIGHSIQHWKYWSRICTVKKKLKEFNWTIMHINREVNKAAGYLAYRYTSIKTKNHHFNQFVGILKFDAISYPYVV
ncbi:unnamed protein product [Cuscuta epithymum]|uniref:RNase H type-1 domain-containing protein n=1 Tax=Cuscuta epithymum TaxID=186058 RepID=A0AAV0G948_9ASTE|nr:unnamed protein product [Cuscuta epithymum]